MANRRALAFSRSFLPKKKTFFFLSIFCPLAEPTFPLPSLSYEKEKNLFLKTFYTLFFLLLGSTLILYHSLFTDISIHCLKSILS